MSINVIRFLIGGALFVHGVGHSLGFFMPTGSKLLPNLSEQNARIFSSIFWVLSVLGFIAALLGFLGVLIPTEWWRNLAVGTAVISLLGLVLFGHNWGALNRYGAYGMNIAVLITQLWLRWPPD
jgi:urea transporter